MTITLVDSELAGQPEGIELHGLVNYGRNRNERYRFFLPEEATAQVNLGGDPWLVLLLPLAVALGEPLRIQLPVDEVLFANVSKVMAIWHSWDPELRPVPIEAALAPAAEPSQHRTAQFFTGGVDSFFTAAEYSADRNSSIDELLFIQGYDIPMSNKQAWETASGTILRSAQEMGKRALLLGTNLRETRWKEARWPEHSHGAAILGAGLMLETRYSRLVVPASWNDADLRPWGSHPLLDVLFSTSRTEIVHFGSRWTRLERTRRLVEGPLRELAIDNLRVCSEDRTGRNCCRCEKCLRTMATLELLGVLETASAFPDKAGWLDRIAHQYFDEDGQVLMAQIYDEAARRRRDDVRSAVAAGLARSVALDRRFHIAELETLNQRVKRRFPGLWRLLLPVRLLTKSVLARITSRARGRGSANAHK